MKNSLLTITALLICFFTVPEGIAATIDLQERAFNINGTLITNADPLPGYVNSSLFDFTTGLGSISINYNPAAAGTYSLTGFFDHEIDQTINTFFNEYGTAIGAPAAGQSWEIDEPGYVFGNIYNNLIAGSLDNSNGVPQNAADDVSMALGWTFTLAADEYAVINFAVSGTAPGSGFYLKQTDPDSISDIYLTSSLNVHNNGVQPIPEPSSLILLGAGLAALAGVTWKKRLH